jgi:short-subunit dehydrogenase
MAKTIAVFGIGKGLGLSVAHKYEKEGFNVAMVGRQQSRLDTYLAQFKDSKVKVKGYLADLTIPDQLNTAIDNILKDFGHVDVVFDAHAAGMWVPATKLTVKDAMDAVQLFYLAPVAIVQRLLPPMLERKEVSTLT